MSGALRVLLYLLLGWLGLLALDAPLFGFLNLGAVFVFPVFVLLEVVGVVRALTARGRWAWSYILGNVGMVAATCVAAVAGFIELVAGWRLDTQVSRPLYLGLVQFALLAGVTAGARVRRAPP